MTIKRLYVFTGKGGVGKTTTALAFTAYLNSIGQKSIYLCLDKTLADRDYNSIGCPWEKIDFSECIEKYIGKKLKSRMLAKWIVKTPFFKALLNMVPGFEYLIYMGYILDDKLKPDPNLTVVLDSPSSGHALTMFEACYNFKEIFQSGVLVDDINKMLGFVYDENVLKTNVICLPTTMAMAEGMELKQQVQDLHFKDCDIHLNFSLTEIPQFNEELAPPFLKEKIAIEREVLATYSDGITARIPFSSEQTFREIVYSMLPAMENLI